MEAVQWAIPGGLWEGLRERSLVDPRSPLPVGVS
jgi:hypothetical protein